jgi:hypothetical protein
MTERRYSDAYYGSLAIEVHHFKRLFLEWLHQFYKNIAGFPDTYVGSSSALFKLSAHNDFKSRTST